MSILRTIKCNIPDCHFEQVETSPNAGWPGWGALTGLMDDKTGETELHLCPEHLKRAAAKILKGVS